MSRASATNSLKRLERVKGIEPSSSAWKIVGKPNDLNDHCVKWRPKTALNSPHFYNAAPDFNLNYILAGIRSRRRRAELHERGQQIESRGRHVPQPRSFERATEYGIEFHRAAVHQILSNARFVHLVARRRQRFVSCDTGCAAHRLGDCTDLGDQAAYAEFTGRVCVGSFRRHVSEAAEQS
jgi:hypothetical protein